MLRRSALRNRSSRPASLRRPAEKQARSFRQWLNDRPCYLDGHKLGGCGWGVDGPRKSYVECAHVDHAGDKGAGSKVSDRFAIPLCQLHHDEQGGKVGPFRSRGGWPTFQAKYGFDALKVADDYWKAWPNRAAWERKIAEAGQ